jgi:lactosylceramide 4-alpha-galactosyltransferase
LDLDIIVLRSMSELKNFGGAESSYFIANGLLHMDKRSVVAEKCVEEVRSNFKGQDWGSNGPALMTRVLQKLCNTTKTEEMSRQKCRGLFEVRPVSDFYPIMHNNFTTFFNESALNMTLQTLAQKKSYTIHFWNKLSSGYKISAGSKQPYGFLAAKYCPLAFTNCGDF